MKPSERTLQIERACKWLFLKTDVDVDHNCVSIPFSHDKKSKLTIFIPQASKMFKVKEESLKTVLKIK